MHRLRHYLYGAKNVFVYTDHKPLLILTKSKNITNSKLYRWALLIQEYNVTLKYIRGSGNQAADLMSRICIPDSHNTDSIQTADNDILAVESKPDQIPRDSELTNEQNIDSDVRARAKIENTLYNEIDLLGYEPADLTVHPPPQNCRGWVNFFRIGV